jgi:serine/threonine protein kinase
MSTAMATNSDHDELVVLGEGPVATVLAGIDRSTGHGFALKVFPGRLDRRTRNEVEAELAALAPLRAHAPVLAADDVTEMHDGRCALRMELCTQSLPELITTFGPLSASDALALGAAVAAAVAAAHNAGVVHGGLTPGNVLFHPSGEPVVSDFGRALRRVFPQDAVQNPDYLPPETVRDGSADERSDLYGLGAILHLALTGRPPHQGQPGEQPGERVLRVLGTPVAPLTRDDLPPGLPELVSALLAKEPENRPRDSASVAARLASMSVPQTPGPHTPGTHTSGPQPTAQVPGAAPGGAATAAVFDDFPTPAGFPQAAPHGPAMTAPPGTPPFQDFAAPASPQPVPAGPPGAAPPLNHVPPDPGVSPPRPLGEPILVTGPRKERRRTHHKGLIAAGAGAFSVLAVAAVVLLQQQPPQLEVPEAAPPPRPDNSAVLNRPTAVRVELLETVDRGNFVDLSWRSNENLDFAVMVAAEGQKEVETIYVQQRNSTTVPVDPTLKYCFTVQGTDSIDTWESAPKGIRKANCTR